MATLRDTEQWTDHHWSRYSKMSRPLLRLRGLPLVQPPESRPPEPDIVRSLGPVALGVAWALAHAVRFEREPVAHGDVRLLFINKYQERIY